MKNKTTIIILLLLTNIVTACIAYQNQQELKNYQENITNQKRQFATKMLANDETYTIFQITYIDDSNYKTGKTLWQELIFTINNKPVKLTVDSLAANYIQANDIYRLDYEQEPDMNKNFTAKTEAGEIIWHLELLEQA